MERQTELRMKENKWVRLLAYVTGLVNQELLLQNEYLAAENQMESCLIMSGLKKGMVVPVVESCPE
jgi:hypothetical protein